MRDDTGYRLEPLTDELFRQPGMRARLEALLTQIRIEPERRRPGETLAPVEWRDPRLSFVAREGDRVVGFVTAHGSPYTPQTVFVPWLVVDGPARGRGIGRALLAAVLEAAASTGHRMVALYVQEGDSPALAFYDRLGGERVRLMPPRDDETLRRGAQWVYRWVLP